MRIPGIYILFLLAAAVVLAFALEFVAAYRDGMRRVAFASGDEPSDEKFDGRVVFRLAVVGGVVALAITAAIIIGYSADAPRTSLLLAWPRDHHPESFLLVGLLVYVLALLCGVKPLQPVLLVCLTLPGLIIMALLLVPLIVKSNDVAGAVLPYLIIFFLQPGALILLFIGIGQVRLLRKGNGNFTSGGLVRVLLISIAYICGFPT